MCVLHVFKNLLDTFHKVKVDRQFRSVFFSVVEQLAASESYLVFTDGWRYWKAKLVDRNCGTWTMCLRHEFIATGCFVIDVIPGVRLSRSMAALKTSEETVLSYIR